MLVWSVTNSIGFCTNPRCICVPNLVKICQCIHELCAFFHPDRITNKPSEEHTCQNANFGNDYDTCNDSFHLTTTQCSPSPDIFSISYTNFVLPLWGLIFASQLFTNFDINHSFPCEHITANCQDCFSLWNSYLFLSFLLFSGCYEGGRPDYGLETHQQRKKRWNNKIRGQFNWLKQRKLCSFPGGFSGINKLIYQLHTQHFALAALLSAILEWISVHQCQLFWKQYPPLFKIKSNSPVYMISAFDNV